MSRNYCRIIAVVLLAGLLPVFALNPPSKPQTSTAVVLQSGTALPVRLNDSISTKNARVGDQINGTIAANVVNNGVIVVPQGSPVALRVVETVPASNSSRPARLSLEVMSVRLPSGERLSVLTTPISRFGEVRTGSAVPASQLIYSLPGHGSWLSIAATLANRPTVRSYDVVLESGHLLPFALSGAAAVAR
jgi:hypothetical protein